MADIDAAKRKPRRTKGTPSYYYRNRFATVLIVTGLSIFGLLSLTKGFKVATERFREVLMTETEEERERKYLFSFAPQKRGEQILKILEEHEKTRSER